MLHDWKIGNKYRDLIIEEEIIMASRLTREAVNLWKTNPELLRIAPLRHVSKGGRVTSFTLSSNGLLKKHVQYVRDGKKCEHSVLFSQVADDVAKGSSCLRVESQFFKFPYGDISVGRIGTAKYNIGGGYRFESVGPVTNPFKPESSLVAMELHQNTKVPTKVLSLRDSEKLAKTLREGDSIALHTFIKTV